MRKPILLLVLAAIAVASRSGSTRATPTLAVSFARDPSIYLVSFDGSRPTVVLRAPRNRYYAHHYSDPAWSRDGRRLAVTDYSEALIEGNSEWEIGLVTPPNPKLGRGAGFGSQASWAPDGLRHVFTGRDTETSSDLGIWNTAASREANVLRKPIVTGASIDAAPAWSPDGSKIAFVRSSGTRARIVVIRPDGAGERRVTSIRSGHPSWSPDSTHIVFDDGRRIAVTDLRGGYRLLTNPATRDVDPAWSPDGRWIAFVRYRGKTPNLWLMGADGQNQRVVVRNASEPAWRP